MQRRRFLLLLFLFLIRLLLPLLILSDNNFYFFDRSLSLLFLSYSWSLLSSSSPSSTTTHTSSSSSLFSAFFSGRFCCCYSVGSLFHCCSFGFDLTPLLPLLEELYFPNPSSREKVSVFQCVFSEDVFSRRSRIPLQRGKQSKRQLLCLLEVRERKRLQVQVQQWWSWSWSSHVLVVKSASPKVSREQQDWEEQKSLYFTAANQDCIFRRFRCPLCVICLALFFCSSFQLLLLLPSRLRQSTEKELPEKVI